MTPSLNTNILSPPKLSGATSRFALPLRVPVVAAPMFLITGPELVIEACRAGIVGAFPTVNARTVEELDTWMARITTALREEALAWALQRGSRSGRVAWQYIQDLAGRLGTKL